MKGKNVLFGKKVHNPRTPLMGGQKTDTEWNNLFNKQKKEGGLIRIA